MSRFAGPVALLIIVVAFGSGCTPLQTSLEAQAQANKLAADLHVQFVKAGDAANRSVMADTDEASVAFAGEATQASEAAARDSADLRRVLTTLGYAAELRMLDSFDKQLADYRALDKEILGLAVENTNLKAQRLSFGPVRKAADAFTSAAESVARAASAPNAARAQALAETAVAAIRQIEVLEAPHIAESEDAVMTRLEQEMSASEAQARAALRTLAMSANAADVQRATDALDEVVRLNAQVVALSRQNTNVRSFALSLGRKRMLAAVADDTLRMLADALDKRGFAATR